MKCRKCLETTLNFVLTAYSELITDAVIADDRIAIDWLNSDESMGAILRVSVVDGVEIWSGDIIGTIPRTKRGEMSAVRYNLEGGGVVLIVKWLQDSFEGQGMYEIVRH